MFHKYYKYHQTSKGYVKQDLSHWEVVANTAGYYIEVWFAFLHKDADSEIIFVLMGG